jgi:hypothetical protein
MDCRVATQGIAFKVKAAAFGKDERFSDHPSLPIKANCPDKFGPGWGDRL